MARKKVKASRGLPANRPRARDAVEGHELAQNVADEILEQLDMEEYDPDLDNPVNAQRNQAREQPPRDRRTAPRRPKQAHL